MYSGKSLDHLGQGTKQRHQALASNRKSQNMHGPQRAEIPEMKVELVLCSTSV